jgi:hypothetical protein
MMPLDPMKVSAIGSSTGFSHTPSLADRNTLKEARR